MPNLLNVNGKELKLAIKEAGFTQEFAAKKLGISRQSLNSWQKNEKLSEDILHKVQRVLYIDLFPKEDVKKADRDIELSEKSNNKLLSNKNELSTQGVSFNDVEQVNQRLTYAENSTFPDRGKVEERPVEIDINKWIDPNHIPIPVFDNTYGAETISELLKNDSYKPTVILLKGHLGCHAVVRHIDSAMNKHFPARCQLGIERLRTFKKRIEPGKPYMIVLEELTVTRYVFENDKHFILRSSDVDLYPDMHVDKEEIIEMWRIRSLTPIPDQQLF